MLKRLRKVQNVTMQANGCVRRRRGASEAYHPRSCKSRRRGNLHPRRFDGDP
jgi:hypothetical protein